MTVEKDSMHILVVEDNVINQKVILGMLRHFGYEADVVVNGEQSVQAVQDKGYDLVFMDVQMPIMDGYRATELIRQLPGDKGKTTIVAMTANAMEGDRESCLAAGMDDYLSKPIIPQGLEQVLQKWLPG